MTKKIFDAVKEGNLERVRELIAKKPGIVREKDDHGNTALHRAAQNGHTAVVEYLLEQEADKEARNENQLTPLHWAAIKGHVEVISKLLEGLEGEELSAALNAQDNQGKTALHWAAAKGHKEVVEYLLKQGADKEATDNLGMTPLHLAAEEGKLEVATALIEAEADKEAKDNQDKTPLHFAAIQGHKGIVTLLIAYGADETVLSEEQKNTYNPEITTGKALLAKLADSNAEIYKSAIEDTAKTLALVAKKKKIPNEIIAAITEFTVKPSDPHNLGDEQRFEAVAAAVAAVTAKAAAAEAAAKAAAEKAAAEKEAEVAAEERAAVYSNQIPSHTERVAAERAQEASRTQHGR